MEITVDNVTFDEHGLIPAVVQDVRTGEVLTLAYMNKESLQRTISEKQTWFWSRSRSQLWHKGETSGNVQHVEEVRMDCDGDALVVLVEPAGPACHTGERSCFHNELLTSASASNKQAHGEDETRDLGALLENLYRVIEDRRNMRPEGSYTTYLFDQGLDKILKKIGEESAETIIAAKNDDPLQFVAETSDLLYHLLVLLVERGVRLDEVQAELAHRRGESKRA
ncbi:MAG: bifunctional phosphoribosyl-AMP cyclohydrolase/phosphoribosyl-ATP diphosphatase HisIE [Pyrinomonadaceae bacterium]|nr:bifunctional phosphoribosyl-AMP cyclohydrolase/phosphoribosyl-ATP diphosphatase HisIE [Pyrinomonadaceae bacterium]